VSRSNHNGDNVSFATRRDSADIIFEMLCTCREPAIRTHIMCDCNLSFQQLCYYTALMLRVGLLYKQESRYITTQKGFQYMMHYRHMQALLERKIKGEELEGYSESPLYFRNLP